MVDDPFDMASGIGSSDEFDVDLSESKSGSVPEGIYRLRVVAVEKSVSKSSNNPMWVWDFAIVSDDKGNTQFAGRQPRPEHTVLTAAAMWKLEELLLALGVVDQPGQKWRGKKSDLLGKECWGAIKNSEYNGRPQSNIVEYRKNLANPAANAVIGQRKDPANPFD